MSKWLDEARAVADSVDANGVSKEGAGNANCHAYKALKQCVAHIEEQDKEIALLREGISEALEASTLEAARVPLLGCSMVSVPLTEEDMEWAKRVSCDPREVE